MVILSNSIPKTGSTLIANFQEDLLNAVNVRSGQDSLKARYSGRFIGQPSTSVLGNLMFINLRKGTVVVKSPWPLARRFDWFCRLVVNFKMTVSYRDPRDVILSRIDHGRRSRDGKDTSMAFADCRNVIELIPRTLKFYDNLTIWKTKKYVHCVKYEDLMADKVKVLKEMISFLGWDVPFPAIDKIVCKRERKKTGSWNFNKGTTMRWKNEMNAFERDACKKAFRTHLIRLGVRTGVIAVPLPHGDGYAVIAGCFQPSQENGSVFTKSSC